MAMYSIRELGRREILMMSAVLAGAGVAFSASMCEPSWRTPLTLDGRWVTQSTDE